MCDGGSGRRNVRWYKTAPAPAPQTRHIGWSADTRWRARGGGVDGSSSEEPHTVRAEQEEREEEKKWRVERLALRTKQEEEDQHNDGFPLETLPPVVLIPSQPAIHRTIHYVPVPPSSSHPISNTKTSTEKSNYLKTQVYSSVF
ncbi:hypothetical protein PoB_003650000 [Plakobranchus ocellatus]|uniref:Uncharacterized protein n=1 Tax=Plakobranchus ocellatus TaxID=259542 RepID=A0AAV4ARS2_9GAST|nr:hypothetical protein PoB_003650000 [Plakobranchus ocellatus]